MCRKQIFDAIKSIKRVAVQKFVSGLQGHEMTCIRDRIDKVRFRSCMDRRSKSILEWESISCIRGNEYLWEII